MTVTQPLVAILVAATLALMPSAASADFDPKPKVDCKKAANKTKPACKPQLGVSTDDEIYNAAYWMARQGQYAEALTVLAMAANPNDPKILNATGFATRKLGNVEAALPFYARALAIDPNLVLAREYLGEAYLSKGDLMGARDQLTEIENRCGTTCTAYVHLASHISVFETKAAKDS